MGRTRKVLTYHGSRYKKRRENEDRPSHAIIDPNIPSISAASVQPDSNLPSISAATVQLDSNVQSTSAASVQREQGILPSTSTPDPTSHRPPLKRQKTQATKTSARIAARPHVTYSSQVPTADKPANVVPQVPEPIVVPDPNVDEPPIVVPDVPSVDEPPIVVPHAPSVDEPPIAVPEDPMLLVVQQRKTVEHLPRTYFAARLTNTAISDSSIGKMDKVCRHCGALLFKSELKDQSSRLCCHKGKISLPAIDVPPFLENLIERNDQQSKNYLHNIRQYNSALASVTAEAVHFPNRGAGANCYKVHGQIYHSVGSLSVPAGQAPTYASLFIIDSGEALNVRMGLFSLFCQD